MTRTSILTWRRVPAPVRRGMLPGRWRRRDGAPAKRVGLTVYRPSDSTRRSAGYAQYVAAKPGTGRTVQLHPQEALLQQARALQQSEAFAEYRQRRVVAEHRLARLVQLGIRQSRYFGRAKTRFQLYLAATVANLTLVAAKAGLPDDTGGASKVGSALRAGTIRSAFDFVPARLGQILTTLALLTSASLPKFISPNRAFRPDF